jgi:hypothetical protein
MGSTRSTDKDADFDVTISPSGEVAYEYEADDEAKVRAFILASERVEKPRAPRVLPLADEILTPEEAAEHLGIP